MKIVTADEAHGTVIQQNLKKFLPGQVHDLPDHRKDPDGLNTIAVQQQLPVGDGADKDGGCPGKQGFGMAVKGDGRGGAAVFLRQTAAGLQQLLMAQMDTVKKSQGINILCHIELPFFKCKVQSA